MSSLFKTTLAALILLAATLTTAFAAGIEERITLSLPKGDGPFPTVILMHMTNGPGSAEKKWARTLNKEGYAAVILKSYSSVSGSVEQLEQQVGVRITHLQQAHAWTVKQGWSNGTVSVIGRSHGAWAVFYAMKSGALRSKLHRAVASVPRCDGPRGRTTAMKSRTPVLIVIGSRDRAEYSKACEQLVTQIRSGVQLVSFKSGHQVDVDNRQATKTILSFLK